MHSEDITFQCAQHLRVTVIVSSPKYEQQGAARGSKGDDVMKHLAIGLALLALSTATVVPALAKTAHQHAARHAHHARHAVRYGTPAPLYLYSHHGYFGGGEEPVTGRKALELDGILN